MEKRLNANPRFEAARDAWLETARRGYFRNLNPIYAWHAVTICNLAGHPPRPLPTWCLDHVVTVAVRMRTLGTLNNPKTYPFDEPDQTQDEINDNVFAWQRRKIDPADAVAMLPWVMGVSRRGWNAFARHAAESDATLLAAMHDGTPPDRVQKILVRAAKERNVEPDAVKRRVRRGRRLAKPPPIPDGLLPE